MRAALVLGDQLFEPVLLKAWARAPLPVFMREDFSLCTHFRYHKHKIQFFLAAMRKYRRELEAGGYEVCYQEIGDDARTYEQALTAFLRSRGVLELHSFEIEDKFFEKRIKDLCDDEGVALVLHESPKFLCSREDFAAYLKKSKRPFMKTFYEAQRKRLKILVDREGQPVGGRWSFDDENRKPLPKDYVFAEMPSLERDEIDRNVARVVDRYFADHPGNCAEFWLPTDRAGARDWFQRFLHDRYRDFGPYEDALTKRSDFVNHSVLTPFLNTGLLTPAQVVSEALQSTRALKIPLNSTEGFVRQIIGWREFVRGIYRNFSERQDTTNFWKHSRKLSDDWYQASTGIAPLDDVIRKTLRYGWAHHIERLMVVGSLMLLLEIEPREAHRWFMEMFVDSSDWVMGPNVYGMALFSDGGIFATKPYICGSNYYRKMGAYPEAQWCVGVDGLYWRFIDRHRDFFLKNPRLSMAVRSLDKMDPAKKERLFAAAEGLQKRLTR
jgi:deoxyribodipyrimidine photolyase-related protein